MIERTKGEMIEIMGLECWLPVPPVLEEIDGFALPEEEQKFRRTPLPDIAVSDIDIVSGEEYSITEMIDWDAARREEVIMQTGADPWKLDKNGVPKVIEEVIPDPTFVFPLLEDFRAQELERCHPLTGGYWCMIKGKPYYLTPFHYFYVNWWKLNTGYPDWRWIDGLRFYHWQYTWLDQRSTGQIESSKRGDGKCISLNTSVLAFSGKNIKAGDVRVGDLLMGDDSRPRLVVDSYRGESEMYRIKVKKGESHEVNKNHIIHGVLTRYRGPKGKKKCVYEWVNIGLQNYLKKPYGWRKDFKIRRVGWELDEQEHEIDPYFLGIWLGDGRAREVEIANIDEEVISYLKEYAKKWAIKISSYDGLHWLLSQRVRNLIKGYYAGVYFKFESNKEFNEYFGYNQKLNLKENKEFQAGDWEVTKIDNGLRNAMNDLNLINNKHIPESYMLDSMNNRLSLLAGLIDSDGTLVQREGVPKNFKISQSVKREALCKQMIDLIRSCGFACNYRIRSVTTEGKEFFHYDMDIYGDIERIPTKIKRKQAVKIKRKYNSMYCGFDVEPLGIGEYQGISVTDNKLFLLKDGTVIHNTYRATAKAYQVTIYKKHSHSGIQSKTDDDAEAVFLDKMVEPYKDLPDFFVPINDHGTNPKSGFNFFAPSKSGRLAASQRILQKQALRSKIDFRAAKVEAYDGANINGILIRDEEGKSRLVDVWERHSTTRDSVYRDGKMMGKIASTTTVEKWEAGGENFKKLWDFSDPEYRDEGTGETFTGLYKIWFPAYLTEYQDEWGFPDEEYARRIQAARRRQYITDSDALQKYQLQYPWTEMEMFQTSGITCQYNLTELRALEVMINDPSYNIIRIGNFMPVDGIGSKIKWHDDTLNGRFHVYKFMDEGKDNQWREIMRDGQKTFIPLNEGGFSAGFDPTKTYGNPRKDRSVAAGVFMEKEAFWNPDQTPNFICDYAWKPDDPELAYLDMLYAAMYYGCPFLPESNLGIGSFLKKLGCDDFLLRRPEITYTDPDKANVDEVGLPATNSSNDILLKKAKSWHAAHGWKIKLPRIIRDSIGFNPAERTKFDVEVAKQLAIVAAEKVEKQQPSEVKMEKMFASFSQVGHTGVMN